MADKQKFSDSPRLFRAVRWLVRLVVLAFGWCALVLTILALTPVPWKIYNALGDDGSKLKNAPDFIVVMGGGGIPSESGLMRTFAGADAARTFPKARVVIAMPGDEASTNSTVGKMREELVMRGVAKQRILFEDKGRHTHEQAVNCFKMLHAAEHQPAVLIVTSPEHVRRSLLSFRKAGFTNAAGSAADAEALEVDLRFTTDELKNKPVPDVGQSLLIRYTFWNSVLVEGKVIHEFAALAYYKLLGWI